MAAAMAGMHQRVQQVALASLAIGMFVPRCRIAVLGHGMQVFPAAAQFVQIAQRGQHRIGQHRQQQQRQRRQAQQQAAGSAEGAEQHPPDASRAGQR